MCDLLTSSGRVFDQLEYTRNHSGLFLFLEEDHYMVPDFLHVLKLMSDARPQRCPTCNILSLGTYLKAPNYRTDSSKVSQHEVRFCRRMSCLSWAFGSQNVIAMVKNVFCLGLFINNGKT